MSTGLRALSSMQHAFGSAATATIAVVPASTRQRVAIYRMIVGAGGATNLILQDTSPAAISQSFALTGGSFLVLDMSINGDPWWTTAAGLGLQFANSGSVNLSYDLWYLQGP